MSNGIESSQNPQATQAPAIDLNSTLLAANGTSVLRDIASEITRKPEYVNIDPTEWNLPVGRYARIMSLEQLDAIRDSLGLIVATSGGYAPPHPGHISCIIESKHVADRLAEERGFNHSSMIVIVNGDTFLENKHGKAFMDLKTRCQLLACSSGADYVVPFEMKNDQTVCHALDTLKPHIFTKGGDRGKGNVPEEPICQKHNIEVLYNLGLDKVWSSSDLLKDWVAFANSKAQ